MKYVNNQQQLAKEGGSSKLVTGIDGVDFGNSGRRNINVGNEYYITSNTNIRGGGVEYTKH